MYVAMSFFLRLIAQISITESLRDTKECQRFLGSYVENYEKENSRFTETKIVNCNT